MLTEQLHVFQNVCRRPANSLPSIPTGRRLAVIAIVINNFKIRIVLIIRVFRVYIADEMTECILHAYTTRIHFYERR